ncbi:PEP-CTERM sorting domain-containing protein [Colwellia sp. 20A7]|uniref:PEP-CTERM sorting domain-containing protein n=1 Tax=Colwellia sp. 20A7 TaxID=2689569 RepID=UPI00135BE6C9|nr:PEP-CTERM sorting domain-containing protein [Colwellia sp. 20A7]
MNVKMLKAAFAGLVLSVSGFANAGLISVVFDVTNFDDEIGSFSGTDVNNDFILSLDELSAFNWTSSNHGYVIDEVSDLDGFGDFDLLTNTWIDNGIGWVNSSNDAYYTWNNRSNSISSSWAQIDIVSVNSVGPVSSVNVPEPSTLAIFALGIIGLASRRFKKL